MPKTRPPDLAADVSRRAVLTGGAALFVASAVSVGGATSAQAATSATADRLLAVAASQLGYSAPPGTPSKYGVWYGIPTGQWCAMFVSWCASEAGAADVIPRHAYTPSGAAWFQARGQWFAGRSGAQRGDIVYFDFPGGPDRISHVGIVESVASNGSLNTIEGNTSGTASGDQRNSGVVARKNRPSSIVGFGRPAYAAADANPAPPVPANDKDPDMRIIRNRDTGEIWLVGPHNMEKVGTMEHYNALGQVWGSYTDLSSADVLRVRDSININIVAFAGSLKGQGL